MWSHLKIQANIFLGDGNWQISPKFHMRMQRAKKDLGHPEGEEHSWSILTGIKT